MPLGTKKLRSSSSCVGVLSWSRAAPKCRPGQARPAERIVFPGKAYQHYAVYRYSVVRRVWGPGALAVFLISAATRAGGILSPESYQRMFAVVSPQLAVQAKSASSLLSELPQVASLPSPTGGLNPASSCWKPSPMECLVASSEVTAGGNILSESKQRDCFSQ